jgi:hypothetical protein
LGFGLGVEFGELGEVLGENCGLEGGVYEVEGGSGVGGEYYIELNVLADVDGVLDEISKFASSGRFIKTKIPIPIAKK